MTTAPTGAKPGRSYPGDVVYVWHAALRGGEGRGQPAGLCFRAALGDCLGKEELRDWPRHYHWQHEPCLYAVRQCLGRALAGSARSVDFVDDRFGRSAENAATEHGTQKPVECMRRPMLNNSRRGDLVVRAVRRSGSSVIAAETIERRTRAMELSESYCDLIVRRWQTFTGRVATLKSSGATFAEEAARRRRQFEG